MPEVPGQRESIKALRVAIAARWSGSIELDRPALTKRFPRRTQVLAGWRLTETVASGSFEFLVLVTNEFPWALPIIALPSPTEGVSLPHIEEDGRLCLASSGAAFSLPVDVTHVEQLVADACDLIVQGQAKGNERDYFTEAQNYWALVGRASHSVWLTKPPPGQHALWCSALVGEDILVAPNKQDLKTWAVGARRQLSGGFEPALIVRLVEPLHPSKYPLTMKDLTALVDSQGAGTALRTAMTRWRARRELPVVLVFRFEDADVCLGATFMAPRQIRFPGAKQSGIPGFRHVGRGRKTSRLTALGLAPGRFPHLRVTPVFREFLHARTTGSSAQALVGLHVVIAGCGAIGGQLAVQLAQAGVSRLTLLDNDLLTWQNVGRHVLDGGAVGEGKASAIANAIRCRFPDAVVASAFATWQAYLHKNSGVFQKVDLIIATTGDGAGNMHLDKLAETGEAPAVLFGWIEPFGVAAHAVLRRPGGRGLREICDSAGRLLEPVADLASAPPLPKEPACGAFYQPYSALASLPSVSLIGELAIDALTGRAATSVHRVWVRGHDDFGDNDLSLTPCWRQRLNVMGYNRRFDFVL